MGHMMNVLVTGAVGNVGYITAIGCAEAGLEVVAHDRLKCEPSLADAAGAKVNWVQGDLNDWAHLLEITKKYKIEGVIHSAALSNVVLCRPVPLSATRVNVLATQYILELARQMNWRRVVYVSTGAVFQASDPDSFIKEMDPPSPNNVYGTTKYMGELLVNMYHKTYGVDACTVRASWVWGPPFILRKFDIARGPVPYFLLKALRCEKVHEPSGGGFKANLTYVKDLANALLLAYQKESLPSRIYNISNGKHYTIAQVVDAIKGVIPGAQLEVGPGLKPWSDFHVPRGSFDITRAEKELGFKVQFPLKKAISDYADWLRDKV
jgi:nucleoside-diphosphate-sugar epimerase